MNELKQEVEEKDQLIQKKNEQFEKLLQQAEELIQENELLTQNYQKEQEESKKKEDTYEQLLSKSTQRFRKELVSIERENSRKLSQIMNQSMTYDRMRCVGPELRESMLRSPVPNYNSRSYGRFFY